MDVLLLCARVSLALIFIAAAVGKLLDAEGSRRALTEFGVPTARVAMGARLLPIAELLIAAGLLAEPVARIAAVAAIALLAAFIFGIARAMGRGEAPDCHCFGQLHSAPAGRGTIVRNVLMTVLAALVAVGGAGETLGGATGAALVAAGAIAAGLAIAALILVRENRRLRKGAAPQGGPQPLAIGTPAPELQLQISSGGATRLAEIVAPDRPTALVFVAPGCGPCDYLLPHLARWQPAVDARVKVVVVSGPETDDDSTHAGQIPGVVWDVERRAESAYRLDGSPAALLVNPDGTIASSPAVGYEAIEALLRVAQRRSYASPQPLTAA